MAGWWAARVWQGRGWLVVRLADALGVLRGQHTFAGWQQEAGEVRRMMCGGWVISLWGWHLSMLRSYHPEHTGSHQNSEVKLDWAGLVLC